jgi:hypothetical protein
MAKHVEEMTKHKSHEKGCVVKCDGRYRKDNPKTGLAHSYRYNGHHEIQGNGTKSRVYNGNFTSGTAKDRMDRIGRQFELKYGPKGGFQLPKDPRKDASAWRLNVDPNFTDANIPYVHNYHHLVPWEVLKKVFSESQLKLVQLSTYSLNDGINLIILPRSEKIGQVLRLPTHTDNHPEYTFEVHQLVMSVKMAAEAQSSTHRINSTNVGSIKADLESIEGDCWDKVVGWGRTAGDAGFDLRQVDAANF